MRHFVIAVTLAAMWLVAIGKTSPVLAQLFQRPQPGYNTQVEATRGPAISRESLRRMTEAGQGIDENGYYRRPIPVTEAYRDPLPEDGLYEYPMVWQPENSVLLEIRERQIIRQDYRLTRSAEKGVK